MYSIYTVRYGDTLNMIASMFNTTLEELKKLNNFNIDNISMGSQLIVPSNQKDMLKTYVVITGDTLYDIARRNNVDVNTILLLNGLNQNDYLYPGQEIVIPANTGEIYVTKEGDTLGTVLDTSGIMLEDLVKENKNIYLLPDQMIILKG